MKDWENLIDTVRTFPVLYDPRHKDYMKTNLKDRVWDHISKKLNIRDGEMAKTQWIKLRNCYRVSLWRQMKKRSDHSDAFIRPWLYQKNMEFLLPFMRNYRSLGELIDFNGSHEEDDHTYGEANNDIIDYETIVNEFEASKKQGNSSNELETFDYVDNVECELREISPKKVSPKKKPPMINNTSEENMILKTLKRLEEKSVARNLPNSFTNINQPSSEDPLFSFFLSMYDTTKNLPVRQQLEVRRQVFSLITKVEENILINESGSSNYSGVVVVGTRNNESSTYLSDSSQWRQ